MPAILGAATVAPPVSIRTRKAKSAARIVPQAAFKTSRRKTHVSHAGLADTRQRSELGAAKFVVPVVSNPTKGKQHALLVMPTAPLVNSAMAAVSTSPGCARLAPKASSKQWLALLAVKLVLAAPSLTLSAASNAKRARLASIRMWRHRPHARCATNTVPKDSNTQGAGAAVQAPASRASRVILRRTQACMVVSNALQDFTTAAVAKLPAATVPLANFRIFRAVQHASNAICTVALVT